MPQSSSTFLPRNESKMAERPTSFPAPSGMTVRLAADMVELKTKFGTFKFFHQNPVISTGTCSALRFISCDESLRLAMDIAGQPMPYGCRLTAGKSEECCPHHRPPPHVQQKRHGMMLGQNSVPVGA